jgi:hypothetical protein
MFVFELWQNFVGSSNNFCVHITSPNGVEYLDVISTSLKCVVHFNVAWCLFRLVENRAPWNMSLETWTSKPTTHQNMSHFNGQLDIHFDAQATQTPKTCNILGVMFQPDALIFHVPPWPIHEALNFESLSCVFSSNSNVFIAIFPPKIYSGFW